jgi:hypothetical protein
MEMNRIEEFRAVCRYISHASFLECATIISEIRCSHDNLYVFNRTLSTLDKVDSVTINGEGIQLNINEADGEQEKLV